MNQYKKQPFSIALIGNPNVGKTSVFNALTGSRQTVGNWPGVTVEYKSGNYSYQGMDFEVIDLPGIYSLTANSPDEQVARDYIRQHPPDLLVNVIDAANLERNLYLSMQLIEMQVPILVCLTMLDIAEQNQLSLDIPHLQRHLDLPVVPVRMGAKDTENHLKSALQEAVLQPQLSSLKVAYDEVVELALASLHLNLSPNTLGENHNLRWKLIKLLEGDAEIAPALHARETALVNKCRLDIEKHRRQNIRNVIADDRYGFIHGLSLDVVKRKQKWKRTFSDSIDRVALSGALGLPIFFAVMWMVFFLTIKASEPIVSWIDTALSWLLVQQTGALLSWLNAPAWLMDFLTHGIGSGMVTVATFTPPIFFIFMSLSFLEDSGYMSRAAFVADKIMRKIGLPGKAFIPLLVGFGCTVPAIMATRTLESKRDRILASLLTSFMSCGAKLPVYTFLGMIFFPGNASSVVFGLYMIGIGMALLTGLLLKKTLFRSQPADFVMELPAYHLPTLNGIFMHTWHRLKDFVLRAGATILSVIAVMYVLQMISFPVSQPEKQDNTERVSLLEAAGKAINPVFRPMGIDQENWHASVGLISGLFAKEAIVGSLQSLYTKQHNEQLGDTIRRHFKTNRAGFAYLLFILLYSPCAAALTMLWKEHGRGWTAFAFVYLTALAWMIATLYYQISNLKSAPSQSVMWIGIISATALAAYFAMYKVGKGKPNAA